MSLARRPETMKPTLVGYILDGAVLAEAGRNVTETSSSLRSLPRVALRRPKLLRQHGLVARRGESLESRRLPPAAAERSL
jgi:hypothetical protein